MVEDENLDILPHKTPDQEFAEILQFKGIPLAYSCEQILRGEDLRAGRYGSLIALLSGRIIRRVTAVPFGDFRRLEVFGITKQDIFPDLHELSEKGTNITVDPLEKFNQDIQNPLEAFPSLKSLEDNPEILSLTTRILYKFLQDTVKPDDSSLMIPFSGGYRWDICKDSEFYLAKTLQPTMQSGYGARANVYTENGIPVLYQKKGGYKIEFNEHQKRSNTTAINLIPICVNGILLPPGTLVGIDMNKNVRDAIRLPFDEVYDLSEIGGIQPLRLTFFAVNSDEARVAFGEHYTECMENLEQVVSLSDFQKRANEIVDGKRIKESN